MSTQIAVVAIGGNSLIRDKQHQSVADQYEAMKETTHHISEMIFDGWNVALAHGNGPQVGFILRRSELAAHELHEVPLDAPDASSASWSTMDGRAPDPEGREWLTGLLALPGAAGHTDARAKVLNGAGLLAWVQGDYVAARSLHEESLALRRELGVVGWVMTDWPR